MLHLVYCIKDHVQGYCMSSGFILGYFIWIPALTFSVENEQVFRDVNGVLVVCMFCTVCVCLLEHPCWCLGVLALESKVYLYAMKL